MHNIIEILNKNSLKNKYKVIGECNHGLMFNPVTSQCDYPENVDCEGKEVAAQSKIFSLQKILFIKQLIKF